MAPLESNYLVPNATFLVEVAVVALVLVGIVVGIVYVVVRSVDRSDKRRAVAPVRHDDTAG